MSPTVRAAIAGPHLVQSRRELVATAEANMMKAVDRGERRACL